MDAYANLMGKMKALEAAQEPIEDYNDDVDWRDQAKYLEQRVMCVMDNYAELAKAIGVPCEGFWGDPGWSHNMIVKYAKALKEKAWQYDKLCD